MITKSELDKLLHYEPETGNLIRKVDVGTKVKAGDIAGSYDKDNYIVIQINRKIYKAHRVIWVMVYGSIDSKLSIDHINQVRDDNRIENLRLVTHKENLKNRRMQKNNTSGHVGVCWNKKTSKWVVHINIDGKLKHLGYFIDKNEAIKARQAAEIECGFHENHGRD